MTGSMFYGSVSIVVRIRIDFFSRGHEVFMKRFVPIPDVRRGFIRHLPDDLPNHMPVDIRQASLNTVVIKRQPFMVDAEQM